MQYSRASSKTIAFRSLDTVKHVWRWSHEDIEEIAATPYLGPRSLKIVAHVIPVGGRREDAEQMELFVRATPTQWAQFEAGRDAHIAAVRARHAAAAPAPAAEEDPQ